MHTRSRDALNTEITEIKPLNSEIKLPIIKSGEINLLQLVVTHVEYTVQIWSLKSNVKCDFLPVKSSHVNAPFPRLVPR